MNERAKMLLVESIGSDLSRMSNEITKLKVNIAEGETIDENHIQKYIGISKDFNVFELQRAMATRNVSKTYQIINYFGENPKLNPIIPTLSMLYSFFSKLLIAIELKVRSEKDIQSKLGMSYPAAKDFRPAIANYNYTKVVLILEALKTADLQSKGIDSPSLKEKEIWKELMYKIVY